MKKYCIFKSASKLLIITLLVGNPLLKNTLKVYATASETAEKSEQPMNIEETTEVVDVSKVIDSDNARKNQMNSPKLKIYLQ